MVRGPGVRTPTTSMQKYGAGDLLRNRSLTLGHLILERNNNEHLPTIFFIVSYFNVSTVRVEHKIPGIIYSSITKQWKSIYIQSNQHIEALSHVSRCFKGHNSCWIVYMTCADKQKTSAISIILCYIKH